MSMRERPLVAYYALSGDKRAEEIVSAIKNAGMEPILIPIDPASEEKIGRGAHDFCVFDLGERSVETAANFLERSDWWKGRIWIVEPSPTVRLDADGLISTPREAVIASLLQAAKDHRDFKEIRFAEDFHLSEAIRETTTETLACALRTAPWEVSDRFFRCMSRGASSLIRETNRLCAEPSAAKIDAARRQIVMRTQVFAASYRLLRIARTLVVISFIVLLATFGAVLQWSASTGEGLIAYQVGLQVLAILAHGGGLALSFGLYRRPGIVGGFFIFYAAFMACFQAGFFNIGFWPEVGLLSSAGLLFILAQAMRSRRFVLKIAAQRPRGSGLT